MGASRAEAPDNRIEFIVHRSMYGPGRSEASTDIYSDLGKAVRLDLQYHYSGPICALNWITLCRQPDYGHHRLVRFIDRGMPQALQLLRAKRPEITRLNLVSLGPGDGEIDIRLIQNAGKFFEVGCYYCLDFSFDLLRYAISRVLASACLKTPFRIKAICGDFSDIAELIRPARRNHGIRLFLLTGFTLGNYPEPKLLQHIAAAMSRDDVLLLDCHLHDLHDWDGQASLPADETSSLFDGYSQTLTNRFVFGPVEAATLATPADVRFGYEISREITTVPKAFNMLIFCTGLRTRMRFTGEPVRRDRLDLACTTFYEHQALLEWLPTMGFQPLWQSRSNSIGLFLLEKRRAIR